MATKGKRKMHLTSFLCLIGFLKVLSVFPWVWGPQQILPSCMCLWWSVETSLLLSSFFWGGSFQLVICVAFCYVLSFLVPLRLGRV